MGINPLRWKARTVVYASFSLIAFYILFIYKKKHQVISEATINNSNPRHVWEYVSDFSNMLKLNPTIEDFNIIAESGNYDLWKYTVQYKEHLSHLPMIRHIAHGNYAVRPDNNGYLISSKHDTCFLLNFICLESVSQFRFDRDGTQDTKCVETVQYECPIAFSPFCYKEVMYQRREIMTRLKSEFNTRNVQNN